MIADLKPYPEYKASSQAWLGDVPQHWSVVPNRALFAEVKDRNHPDEEMLSVTITRGIVRQKALLAGSSKKDSSNLDKSAYKLVQPRDIAYNKMRAWQGAIGASDLRGIISPAYVVMRLRADDDLPSYFHHLYRTPQFAKEAERWSYGITSDMWSLRPEHFKMIYTPEPPPAEQAAIVRFLDWANGRLERAIRAKRKVIALLNEQKQAIIHRAVTRGLDSAVPLKPSGISWLGEVPKYWEVTVAKRVCSVFIPQRDKPELNEVKGIPWVTLENVGKTFVKPSRFYVRDKDAQAVGSRTVPSGSVLASCVGRFGITSITAGPVVINQQIQAFIPRARLSKFFLRYSVLISKPYFEMQGNSTTLAYVDREGFETMPLLIPPLPEQEAIVQHLKEATANLDAAIFRLEREIELLREYRTRLVADVVTGKVDVREAAALLPDETVADTAEDDIDLSDETGTADEEAAV